MPKITKPLYVKYTGDNFRENCCNECRKLIDQNTLEPLDREGFLFYKIDENGRDQLGQKARVRYILGDCHGLSIGCVGHCYWVHIIKGGEEFIYKNIYGEMCNQDPPFSENDPLIKLKVEERLRNLRSDLRFKNDELNRIIKRQEFNNQDFIAFGKLYNKHLAFKRKLSTQTNSAKEIARNKKNIEEDANRLLPKKQWCEKQIKELNELLNSNRQGVQISNVKYLIKKYTQEKEILDKEYNSLRDLLLVTNSIPKINNTILNKIDDNFIPSRLPNVATVAASSGNKIISGGIFTDSFKMQNFTIDTTGANPNSGTTPVIFEAFEERERYVTSATYNNVTGIIDLTWNVEPEINSQLYSLRMDLRNINADEHAVQYDLYGNPDPDALFIDENNINARFLRISNTKEVFVNLTNNTKDEITKIENDIVKAELELSIKNNILNSLFPTGNPIDEVTQRMIYADYIRLNLNRSIK